MVTKRDSVADPCAYVPSIPSLDTTRLYSSRRERTPARLITGKSIVSCADKSAQLGFHHSQRTTSYSRDSCHGRFVQSSVSFREYSRRGRNPPRSDKNSKRCLIIDLGGLTLLLRVDGLLYCIARMLFTSPGFWKERFFRASHHRRDARSARLKSVWRWRVGRWSPAR